MDRVERDDFALKMIRSVAARQKLPDGVADGLPDGFVERIGRDEIRSLLVDRPRIGAVLDRMHAYADNPADPYPLQDGFIPVGQYRFFPADSLLQQDGGDDIRLTEKERDILLELLGAEGKKVSRDTLLDKVWGYVTGVETHTLETHIYRLRQKIEVDPARPVLLQTEEDGYSLS